MNNRKAFQIKHKEINILDGVYVRVAEQLQKRMHAVAQYQPLSYTGDMRPMQEVSYARLQS
jgi:hypothetical protein